jgi:hypothetical protein
MIARLYHNKEGGCHNEEGGSASERASKQGGQRREVQVEGEGEGGIDGARKEQEQRASVSSKRDWKAQRGNQSQIDT